MTEAIPIHLIRVDGGTQIRKSTYYDKIDEYAQAMLDGIAFPPMTVFWDGEFYWLADGFHRLGAYESVCETLERNSIDVDCDVIEGSQREAILYACGANDAHGIQRTSDDKKAAVKTVLENPLVSINPKSGQPWVDAEIARICNVGKPFVAKVRPKVAVVTDYNCRSYESGGKTITRVARSARTPKPDKAETPPAAKSNAEPPPPVAKVVQFVSPWDDIGTHMRTISELIDALPAPNVAAANFPPQLARVMPLKRALEIQHWWQEFTRFWAARDPEIQRHRQETQDFIKEELNAQANAR